MIPASIFYARLQTGNRTEEVRALELGADFFTFRLRKGLENVTDAGLAEIGFGSIRMKGYRKVRPDAFRIEKTVSEKYFDIYKFETEDPSFFEQASLLTNEYLSYINLRYECDEAELSEALTGYDVDEEKFPVSIDACREEWFGRSLFIPENFAARQKMEEKAGEKPEIGMAISFPMMWDAYLAQDKDRFIREWFIKYAKTDVNVEKIGVTHLYFGSQMCMLRWPDETITQLLDKAVESELCPVAAFAPMQEAFTGLGRERLEKLDAWCRVNDRRLEIVVNDLGMLEMIREMKCAYFDVTLGVMLLRHRKDSRRKWKIRQPEAENSPLDKQAESGDGIYTWIDFPDNRRLMKARYGASGVSYEQCGDGTGKLPENGFLTTVYTPYYQMNTSAMCTLYAAKVNGSRGKQVQNMHCPYYCQENYFLYPQGLQMVGIGNTLFGFDPDAFDKEKRIGGADRYVFNLM